MSRKHQYARELVRQSLELDRETWEAYATEIAWARGVVALESHPV